MKVIVKIIPNLFGIGERDREVASSAIWQATPGVALRFRMSYVDSGSTAIRNKIYKTLKQLLA